MRMRGRPLPFALACCWLVSICWAQPALAFTDSISNAIIRNIEADLTRPSLKIRNGSGAVKHMRLGRGASFLSLVLADRSVRVWDLKLGIQRPSIKIQEDRPTIAVPGPRGKNVVVGLSGGTVLVFDIVTGTRRTALSGHRREVVAADFSADGKVLVSAGADRTVLIWDLDRNRQIGLLSGHRKAISAIAVAADGKTVATGSEDGIIRVWDVARGTPLHTFKGLSRTIDRIRFSPDMSSILITTRRGTVAILDSDSGAVTRKFREPGKRPSAIAFDDDGRIAAFATADGDIRLVDLATARTLRKIEGHPGAISHLAYDGTHQRVISAGKDGTVRVWDAKTGQNLVQVVSTTNGWAVIDNQGRFDGSEQGMNDVGWEARGQDVSLGSFAERFFEPGLLAAHLREQAQFLIDVPGNITEGIALPPKVEIDLPHSHREAGRPFTVLVVATDRGGGIGSIRLYHNGKLVQPGSFIQQRDYEAREKTLRVAAFQVKPVAGPNTFRAIGTGLWGVESLSDRVIETFAGREVTAQLHIVAVGINRYSDPDLELSYAVPDAKSIIRYLADAPRGVFSRVVVHRLFDDAATKENILKLLDDIGATRPEDVVVTYFAGHGLIVDDDWMFLPYEARDESDPSSYRGVGITATRIQEALVKAGAHRMLVLFDSCSSGAGVEAIAKLNNFQRRYLRRFSRVAGITILAATRRDRTAFEARELGNGLFTHVVLKGLEGKADKTPRDGLVTAHEIVGYSYELLPEMSRRYMDDPQEPLAYALGADFTLRRRIN